ncbi:MAG: hypothetical protein ILP10_03350 [Lachnospiraceae bacterium]|nr:hypothetical protein [Lachnospiraceae bacterium]
MNENAEKGSDARNLKRAGLEFALIALNKAIIWARIFATLFLFMLCIYAVFHREAPNVPLYIILYANVVPFLAVFVIRSLSKKEFSLPFPQLAKDYRFSKASFIGNLIGTASFTLLLLILKGSIFKILLLGYLVVLAGSFAIHRIALYRKMNAG